MNGLNIGKQIAARRKSNGLTQEALASHLGVTKAAVSKWELGSACPDISLLPRIASFFSTSVDALLDYQPQLSNDEIGEIAARISRYFPTEGKQAIQECRELIKQYYSCPALVMTLGHLMTMGAVCDDPETPNTEIITEVIGYMNHVVEINEDATTTRSALFIIATLEMGIENYSEAIALLESLQPEQPLEVEVTLATAYEKAGNKAKATQVHEENLFWSASSALNSCLALINLANDDNRIQSLFAIATPLSKSLQLNEAGSMHELSLNFYTACAYRRIGNNEQAYQYLNLFADLASSHKVFLSADSTSEQLFPHIQETVNPEMKNDTQEYLDNTMVPMLSLSIPQMLESAPEWADAHEEAEYQAVIAKLAKALQ